MDRIRKYAAGFLMTGFGAAEAWTAWAWRATPRLWVTSAVFSVVLMAAAVGVMRGRAWARWVALGAGVCGLANAAVFLVLYGDAYPQALLETGFIATISTLTLATLVGPKMAASFATSLPDTSYWRRSDLRTRVLAGAMVMALPGAAMLIMFSAVTRLHPYVFGATAALMGLGALLTFAERAAGVVVLGASAIVSGVMAVELGSAASSPAYSFYGRMLRDSASFALPLVAGAAATSAVAFAFFAGSMGRMMLPRSR